MADNKNNFTISPCLFIELGTNGWKIPHDLRKFVIEEFERPGFLVFATWLSKRTKTSDRTIALFPTSQNHMRKLSHSISPLPMWKSSRNDWKKATCKN